MEEYSYTFTHPLGHTGPVTGKFYFLHEIYRYCVLWKIVPYLYSSKKLNFKHTSRLINFRHTEESRQWVSCHRVLTDRLLAVGPNLTSEVSYTEIIFARRLREKKLKESPSRSLKFSQRCRWRLFFWDLTFPQRWGWKLFFWDLTFPQRCCDLTLCLRACSSQQNWIFIYYS